MGMRSPGYFLRRARELPLGQVIRKGFGLLAREAENRARRARDEREGSYLPSSRLPAGALRPRLRRGFPEPPVRARASEILAAAERVLAHRFDLLGSGPVEVAHGAACAGVLGEVFPPGDPVRPDPGGGWLRDRVAPPNLDESRRIWQLLANENPGYVPIDWQLDFRSGYRWNERSWYRKVPFGHLRGADVKVPWELGRMQHLPALGLAWGLTTGSGDTGAGERVLSEFRSQVLDFVATNPPRYGVQWVCTMDVAIRTVNWLLAYDLFRAAGAHFDEPFEGVFRRSIFEHALHIATNLEWWEGNRANHYLANVAGLTWASACLPPSPASEAWLDFASGALAFEIRHQFHEDGGHFEASTGYHRLSAEMVAFAGAVLVGLEGEEAACLGRHGFSPGAPPPVLWPPPAPSATAVPEVGPISGPGCVERIEGMGQLVRDYSNAAGWAVQVGDDDSGRFVKLAPPLLPDGSEAALDHRHLPAAISALLHGTEPGREDPGSLDAAIVHALADGRRLDTPRPPRDPRARNPQRPGPRPDGHPSPGHRARIRFALTPGELASPRLAAYPDFGLFCYRLGLMHLTVRAPRALPAAGGHRHDDALSLTLSVAERQVLVDPGSPFYSPFPDMLASFRSAAMHNGPRPRPVPARGSELRVEVLEAIASGFTARVSAAGTFVRRTLHFEEAGFSLEDEASARLETMTFVLGADLRCDVAGRCATIHLPDGPLLLTAESGGWELEETAASPGYGRRETRTGLRWVPE